MDGLSKKIIALVGRVELRAEGERAGYRERMMGSDSGLSRGSGCPEKCEAQAIRWQNRTGCQSGKVALIWRKAKESACQPCSALLSQAQRGEREEGYSRKGTDRRTARRSGGSSGGGGVCVCQ